MQEATVPLLVTWQNFYVIIGSAAGTLTGLMFVAITLLANTRQRGADEGIAAFSTPNVVHFCTALFIAAIFNAPWQVLWQVALLLGLAGLGGIGYNVIIVQRARHQSVYQPVLEDWLWYTILPFVAYIALVIAAVMLLGNPASSLFVIGAVTILLLFIGIHNAWDLVTYITITRFQGEDQSNTSE